MEKCVWYGNYKCRSGQSCCYSVCEQRPDGVSHPQNDIYLKITSLVSVDKGKSKL